jgi:hypothetical protein
VLPRLGDCGDVHAVWQVNGESHCEPSGFGLKITIWRGPSEPRGAM